MTALFARELRLAWAGGGGPAGPAAFSLAALTLAPFAIGPDADVLVAAGPGVIAFAAFLSVLQPAERLFGDDAADGTLELYALAGPPLWAVGLTKTAAFTLAVHAPAAPIAGLAALLYGLDPSAAAALAGGLLLALPGLSLIAAFAGALAAGLKRAGLLIALIAAPLCVPLLIFAAGAGRAASAAPGSAGAYLALAAAGSLAALALAPGALSAALRARLE